MGSGVIDVHRAPLAGSRAAPCHSRRAAWAAWAAWAAEASRDGGAIRALCVRVLAGRDGIAAMAFHGLQGCSGRKGQIWGPQASQCRGGAGAWAAYCLGRRGDDADCKKEPDGPRQKICGGAPGRRARQLASLWPGTPSRHARACPSCAKKAAASGARLARKTVDAIHSRVLALPT
ncbi:hypothetical protein BS50DRAFT_31010 [Corynespora cassiicola Philippines]|uniref:Uncharacterized protein n=1 Tax=Corynespora cassiicola Philippines TaxID=1448308 RepID=A0A2T2PBI7_CORCC|nr:hypothetical protein BS50DRAFT_31010 [Corynespora cassiicola Philippines]